MKKVLLKFTMIAVMSIVIILGLVYLGLGYYYRDSFVYGTRINGIYCTGRTVEEVNNLLTSQYQYNGLDVSTDDGEVSFTIPAEAIDFQYDFGEALNTYLMKQNPWLWPQNLLVGQDIRLNPVVCMDETKLDREMDQYEILIEQEKPVVQITFDQGVYELVDNHKHRPDCEAIRQGVAESIYNSESQLIIEDDLYYDAPYSKEDYEVIKSFEEIDNMLGADITYVLGDDFEIIDKATLTSFLLINESADQSETCTWNEDAIKQWVDDLADKYDSIGKSRQFKTTRGQTIIVDGGTYGNEIDRAKEYEYLLDAISQGISDRHEPEYKHKAWHQGADDIGDTYVEVDMSDQKMYYYEEGKLIVDTPIVTGNLRTGSDTPDGTNFVYFKQRNRVLIGPDYQTPVKYWMAVKGHIGIHDASWRNEFGGDIFKTSGSHGCINTPTDAVSQMYDLVEVGTPVVMYYIENH